MLEGHTHFLLEDYDDEEGQIGGDEDVFISPIQAWIDGVCEKDKFPCQGLMIQEGKPSHEEENIGKGMVILMFEGMFEHVDEKLQWLH